MASPFDAENTASRRRLEAVASRLSDADLERVLPNGWTVGGLFAHLCFLDRRVLVLLRRWKGAPMHDSPLDADAMNEAAKPIFLALGGRETVRLALEAAAAVDAEIGGLTPEFIGRIGATQSWLRLNRSLHRSHHLDQIERVLGSE